MQHESLKVTREYGVLIADDDAAVREMLEASARHAGFSVWLATDGREAIELYRQQRDRIHVVLLDVRMPVMDGPQALLALRAINPVVRCCFMSGGLGGYRRSDLVRLGAAQVFDKPFLVREVFRTLGRLAESATGQEESFRDALGQSG